MVAGQIDDHRKMKVWVAAMSHAENNAIFSSERRDEADGRARSNQSTAACGHLTNKVPGPRAPRTGT